MMPRAISPTKNKNTFSSLFTGLLPLFVLAHGAHHILTALPTPLLPMIRTHFSLGYTQAGWLISAFSLSYGIGQLPAGWLADRLGPRNLIASSICGVAVAGFLIGLSSTYTAMVAFFILMGITGGGYHPSAPPLIAASVEPGNLGRALGLHMIGGSASYFLSPLIAVAIAAVWGWRSPFILLAIPTIVFGVILYGLLPRPGRVADKDRSASNDRIGEGRVSSTYGLLVLIIVLSTLTSAILMSTISFIPLMLVDRFGVGEKTAAALLALVFSTGLWAAPAGGHLADRVGKIPVVLTVCFVAGPIVYLLTLCPYGAGTWLLLLALGVCLSVRMPVVESYIVEATSERNRSTILGIYYFSAMESGGLLTPVMGNLIDRFGFYASFTTAGLLILGVTLICSFWLWGNRR